MSISCMTIEVRELHMKGRSLSGGRAEELGINTGWKYLLNKVAISLSEHTYGSVVQVHRKGDVK